MDGDSYSSNSYKLRSAGPVPIGGGRFVTQTFGMDSQIITTYPATTTINKSDDMMGIEGGIYISANWQRLPYFNASGNQLFSGNTITKPEWLDQDEIT